MAKTEPIRDLRQIRELAAYYQHLGQLRNHVLIVLALYTALRISDLLRLTWDDVYDFDCHRVRKALTLREGKTGKAKTIALNKDVVKALLAYAETAAPGRFLILNEKTRKAICRTQAYRIIRAAAKALRFAFKVSCHSLRKTFGYQAWKAGTPLAVIMEIFNHTSFAVTMRYLCISQDDVDRAYLRLQLLA